MDDRRFDTLVKTLAATGSRRATLRMIAASTLAAGLSRLGREEVDAKCVKPGKTCKRKHGKKKKCCNGAKCKGKKCKCTGGKQPCGQTCCQEGQLFLGGQCVPGPGTCPTDGTDYCTSFFDSCNGNPQCRCYTTMAQTTRCAAPGGFQCGDCTSDADCVALGPGAFCVQDTGSGCGCTDGEGFCKLPCPS